MTVVGVRRDKASFPSGCKSHPATAPDGYNGSRHEGDEMAGAFSVECLLMTVFVESGEGGEWRFRSGCPSPMLRCGMAIECPKAI